MCDCFAKGVKAHGRNPEQRPSGPLCERYNSCHTAPPSHTSRRLVCAGCLPTIAPYSRADINGTDQDAQPRPDAPAASNAVAAATERTGQAELGEVLVTAAATAIPADLPAILDDIAQVDPGDGAADQNVVADPNHQPDDDSDDLSEDLDNEESDAESADYQPRTQTHQKRQSYRPSGLEKNILAWAARVRSIVAQAKDFDFEKHDIPAFKQHILVESAKSKNQVCHFLALSVPSDWTGLIAARKACCCAISPPSGRRLPSRYHFASTMISCRGNHRNMPRK